MGQPHVPDRPLPTPQQARARRQQAVAPLFVAAPAVPQLPHPWRTPIALGSAVWDAALPHQGPWSVRRFARGSRAAAWGAMARSRPTAGSSGRHKPRHLEPNRLGLQEATGQRLPRGGHPMARAALVPRSPRPASQAVPVQDTTSWTFPWAVRSAGLGPVRLGVRGQRAAWTGTSGVWGTTRADGRVQRLRTLSGPRGPRAPFLQDGHTSLGLAAYRRRSAAAMGKHGGRVCVASSCVHRAGLPPSPTHGHSPLKTIGEAWRPPKRSSRR